PRSQSQRAQSAADRGAPRDRARRDPPLRGRGRARRSRGARAQLVRALPRRGTDAAARQLAICHNPSTMQRAGVVVIGAGVIGASIAYHLARRRIGRVVLVEKHTVCSGTSAKSSAIVRTHYSTRPTAAIALLARQMIVDFRDEIG